MGDTGFTGNLAQAEPLETFFREDFDACLDECVFQVAMVVRFFCHAVILNHSVDKVKN
ncbi:MAG: hypothetical protein ACD_34C00052G0001 [uncultured bacterium]|nr:MAG: hypothetical protein ACD_34C00052G0001 [uncultured bacterium]